MYEVIEEAKDGKMDIECLFRREECNDICIFSFEKSSDFIFKRGGGGCSKELYFSTSLILIILVILCET